MLEPPSWSFDGFAGERVIVVRAGASFDPPFVPLPVALAVSLLAQWLGDPVQRRTLLDVHETLFGRFALEPWAHGDAHLPLTNDLRLAFERGDLVLIGIPDDVAPGIAVIPRRPTPIPIKRPQIQLPKRTFIEIELLDENGRRVATDLVVTLPDGSRLTPSFPGFIRIDDIDPGTCDIEFPKIDGREWGSAMFRR